MNSMEKLYPFFIQYLLQVVEKKQFSLLDFTTTSEPVFKNAGYRSANDFSRNKLVKTILIIRLDEIGDVLLTTGFIRELRQNYPFANITLVVKPAVLNLVELCPYVNRVLTFDWPKANQSGFVGLYAEALEFCRQYLWEKHFDLCIMPRWDIDNYFSLMLGYLSGSHERIGYSENVYAHKKTCNTNFDLLLTQPVMNPPAIIHEVEKNDYLLKIMKATVLSDSLEFWRNKRDDLFAQKIITAHFNKPPIAVVPGAGKANKIWPIENYCKLLAYLNEQFQEQFIILGSKEEEPLGNEIIKNLPNCTVVNSCGKTTLRQASAILNSCKMYIGNDTSLMHMAAVEGLKILMPVCHPLVANIDTVNSPVRFGPWKSRAMILQPNDFLNDCKGKYSCIAEDAHCIKQITVDEMLHSYRELSKVF